MIRPDSIQVGDRVVEKAEHWKYYTKDHPYNEHDEKILRHGSVIAKSKYGVLVKWDEGFIAQNWIEFKKFNVRDGYHFYGMTSNTYYIYEKENS